MPLCGLLELDVVLLHHDEAPLFKVVGVAVEARQFSFGLLNTVFFTGVAAQRLQQSLGDNVHNDHGPMRPAPDHKRVAQLQRVTCAPVFNIISMKYTPRIS